MSGELDEFEDEFGEEPLPSTAVSTKQRLNGLKAAARNKGRFLKPKLQRQLIAEKAWQAPCHKRRPA